MSQVDAWEQEARKLERQASDLRSQARQARARALVARVKEFESKVGEIYASGDYAGMEVGDWKFYYGYEQTVAGDYAATQEAQDNPDGDDENPEWAFVAWYMGSEMARIATSDLHPEANYDTLYQNLLAGIMHLIRDGRLT